MSRLTTIARAITGAVSALCAGAAFGFAPSVSPPPGYDPGSGTFRPSSPTPVNGGRIGGGQVGVPTGGGTVRRPITFRIPPGAGKRIASGIIRGGGLGAVAGLATWAAERCVHFKNGGLFLRCDGPEEDYLPGERVYHHPYAHLVDHGSADAACKAAVLAQSGRRDLGHRIEQVHANAWRCYAVENGQERLLVNVSMTHLCRDENGQVKWTSDSGKCPLPTPDGQPITEEEAAERLSPTLPPVIPPGVETPVEQPVWNPSPSRPDRTRPVTAPVGDPVPHTERTPDGERRTVWTQPTVTITHTPTESDPMRFDVQPGRQNVPGPNTRTGEVNGQPVGQPQPDPAKPNTETQIDDGQQKPEEETDALCSGEGAAEILACQKMGELDDVELPEREVTMTFAPDSSFSRAGMCPADKTISIRGTSVTFSYRMICDFAQTVRPLFLAFAGLAAGMMIIGAGRRE